VNIHGWLSKQFSGPHRRLSKTTFRVTFGYECKFPAEGLLEGFSQFNRSKQEIYYGFSSQKDSLKF
jgi:hypothetical protein